jgi:hypothetical protein
METDDRPVVLVGIAVWVVTFVVLVVFFRDDLRRHHTEWWLWSCGIGVLFGLYGLRFVSRRQQAIARDRGAPTEPQEWPNGSPESASLTDPGSCPSGPPTMSIPKSSSSGGGGAGAAGTTTASE